MESFVLCWWGDEVRIIDAFNVCSVHVLAERNDPVPEILQAVAAEFRGGRRVRIVYQPDALEAHEVGLAGLSLRPGRSGSAERNRLRPLLVREFAALSEPGTVWCLAPGGAGGAVLYLERNSPLPRIVEGLASGGVVAEGAWPLPALADCTPPGGAGARGGSLSVASAAGRAMVACVNPAGDRSVDLHAHGDIVEGAMASLRNALARFDEGERPAGWLAVDEGPAAAALRSATADLGLTEVSIAGLLARVRLLAPGGWPDLLPASLWWRQSKVLRRLIPAAVVVLLLASAICIRTSAARKEALLLRQRRDEEATLVHVRAEAGRRETRTERIRALASAAADLKTARASQGDFLLALASSISRSSVLSEVAVDDGRITLCGRVCDHSLRCGEVAAKLCADLAPPGVPWALRPDPLPSGGSDFFLRGSFDPRPAAQEPSTAAEDTPDALARSEEGFAAACARLSAAGSFEERLGALCRRGWTASEPATDRRNGYELRHYSLRRANPRLGDWPEIVASVRILCDEPGLTIDRLLLTAAPDGAAVFIRAELGLTVRLRP